MARSVAASQAGASGSGSGREKSLAVAISASAELRLPGELAVRAQRQTKICMPQVRTRPAQRLCRSYMASSHAAITG